MGVHWALRPHYTDLPEEHRRLLRRHERVGWAISAGFVLLYGAISVAVEATVSKGIGQELVRFCLVALVAGLLALLAIRTLLDQAAEEVRRRERSIAAHEQAVRLQGVLLATRTMQHHINNQLAIAVGYADLLLHDASLGEQQREMAGEVLRGAQDAVATLEKLREITRLEQVPSPLGMGADSAMLDLDRSRATPAATAFSRGV